MSWLSFVFEWVGIWFLASLALGAVYVWAVTRWRFLERALAPPKRDTPSRFRDCA